MRHEPFAPSHRYLPNAVDDSPVPLRDLIAVPQERVVGILQIQVIHHVVGPGPVAVEGHPSHPALGLDRQGVVQLPPVRSGHS